MNFYRVYCYSDWTTQTFYVNGFPQHKFAKKIKAKLEAIIDLARLTGEYEKASTFILLSFTTDNDHNFVEFR